VRFFTLQIADFDFTIGCHQTASCWSDISLRHWYRVVHTLSRLHWASYESHLISVGGIPYSAQSTSVSGSLDVETSKVLENENAKLTAQRQGELADEAIAFIRLNSRSCKQYCLNYLLYMYSIPEMSVDLFGETLPGRFRARSILLLQRKNWLRKCVSR
jgi:hypothetical protein